MVEATTISVIVCAYSERRWDRFLAALDSIRRQDTQLLEIIAVIYRNPAVEKLASGAYPAARNAGVHLAQERIVAFLDDDTVAQSDWLVRIAALFADPSIIGALGTNSLSPAMNRRR